MGELKGATTTKSRIIYINNYKIITHTHTQIHTHTKTLNRKTLNVHLRQQNLNEKAENWLRVERGKGGGWELGVED